MKRNYFLSLFALFTLCMMAGLSSTNAQVTEQRKMDEALVRAKESKRDVRKEQFAKELNLSQKQREDLAQLKTEGQVERGRMQDKHKADKMAMHEKNDKKLRSILDEKQYYAYKAKKEKHSKKMRKHGRKRHEGGHGHRD